MAKAKKASRPPAAPTSRKTIGGGLGRNTRGCKKGGPGHGHGGGRGAGTGRRG